MTAGVGLPAGRHARLDGLGREVERGQRRQGGERLVLRNGCLRVDSDFARREPNIEILDSGVPRAHTVPAQLA